MREFSEVGVLEEALEGPDVGLVHASGDGPVVKLGVRVEVSVGAIVVQPADVLGSELFEKTQLGDCGLIEGLIIRAAATRRASVNAHAVRVGRLDFALASPIMFV